MSSWRLAPDVLRLSGRRLAGGAPFRVVRLTEEGERVLERTLGSSQSVVAGTPAARLVERLLRAGILLSPTPSPTRVTDVTVVIPALSSAGQVQEVIDHVPGQLPVIVVDDGSSPPLSAGLRPRPGLTILRHDHARGPAAARNSAAAAVSTSWIAFVDADVVPGAHWLGVLLAAAEDDVVAVAPRVTSGPGARGLAGLVETWADALDLGATPTDVGPGRPLSYVPTATLLVRRSAFEQVGGFDEALRVGEDVDLVWRLVQVGRVRYEPGARCSHRPRTTLTAVLRRRFAYGTSAAALDRRHPGAVRHADVPIWSLVPWVVAVLASPGAGLAVAGVVTAIAPRFVPELSAADARTLVIAAHKRSFAGLARYLARPLGPLAFLVALLLPRRRRTVIGTFAIGTAVVLHRRIAVDKVGPPTVATAARVVVGAILDDAAYAAGVWVGCARERRWRPLLPRVRQVPRLRRRPVP